MAPRRSYPSFLIYLDDAGDYRWVYQSSADRTTASGADGFKRMVDCEAAIEEMKRSRAAPIWSTDEARAKRR